MPSPMFIQDFNHILKDDLGSDVEYKSYITGKTKTIRAVIDLRKFDEKENEGRVVVDEGVAYCNLEIDPVVYDVLIVEGVEYKVMGFSKRQTQYKLLLKANATPTGSHTSGRFR